MTDMCMQLHSTPHGSIKSYSLCKSDMFLFTLTPNWWMSLYNANGRFILPGKVICLKTNKALCTTELFIISVLFYGWIWYAISTSYFLIIYAMLLPGMIHGARNIRLALCTPRYEQRVRYWRSWLEMANNFALLKRFHIWQCILWLNL